MHVFSLAKGLKGTCFNRMGFLLGLQQVPGYLARSTWLDAAIEAVVAGLNTAEYVRDLTPRARTRRRRAGGPAEGTLVAGVVGRSEQP